MSDDAGPDDQREEAPVVTAGARAQRLQIPSTRPAVDTAIAGFLREATASGVPASAMFGLRLALEEALSNALHHGNNGDPSKKIGFNYSISPSEIMIDVEDEGEGFDASAVPDPTQDENLLIPAGRGLILMRAYMKSVEYLGCGNRVRLRWVEQVTK